MKILMTIRGDYVAPRFDCAAEVLIATCYDHQLLEEPRSIILDHVSAERICDIALKENISILICGGIEEQHYQFLVWKKIQVFDGVVGLHEVVLQAAMEGRLSAGNLFPGVTTWGIRA
nr:hypothetical protein [uncultured Desulfobulbus sp.]